MKYDYFSENLGLDTVVHEKASWMENMMKYHIYPDSKVHGTNMGPNWGQQDPGGSHGGSMNLAIWVPINLKYIIDHEQQSHNFFIWKIEK